MQGDLGVGQGSVSSVLHLRVLESDVRLAVPDQETRDALSRQWSRCAGTNALADPDSPLEVQVGTGSGARSWLTVQVTRLAMEALLGRRLMMHAAGVADEDGRVIALVGRSEIGKSTAAATLARSDFGYVTDETIAVRRDNAVLPFPRPLALHDPETGREVEWGPDELGLQRCPDGLSLARIVVLDRDPARAGPPTVTPLPLIDGILALVPQISALGDLVGPLRWLCRLIGDCGGVFRLSYAEIADTAPVLRQLLDAPHELGESWRDVPMPPRNRIGRGFMDGRIRQTYYTDAVEVGDEALLLSGARTPVRLMGIGLTIWRAVHDAPTFEEVVARVVAEHGDHPDSAHLVGEAVRSMVQAGVLGWRRPRTVAGLRVGAARGMRAEAGAARPVVASAL